MDAKKTEAVSVKLPDSLKKYCDGMAELKAKVIHGIADFELVDSADRE